MQSRIDQKLNNAVMVKLNIQDYQALQELSVESDRPMGYLARRMIKTFLKNKPMTSQHT
jgi:hypothetical protein